jgi:hypothetical protein
MFIIGVVLALLWYFCVIIVPAFPNDKCTAAACGGAGGGGGGSSGGTCPDPCRTGAHFDVMAQMCFPNPPPCPTGQRACVAGNGYTLAMDYCINGCEPDPNATPPRSLPCPGGQPTAGFCACPTHYYWDTGNQACVYSGAV